MPSDARAQDTTRTDAPGTEEFARCYFANVADADLAARDPADLAGAVQAHWALGAQRAPGTPVVAVRTPVRRRDGWESPHTVVQIVNDDMPFLVDSVTMELVRLGLGLHLVVHPIVRVHRDSEGRRTGIAADGATGADVVAESYLSVEVDRETDAAVLDDIAEHLRHVLADVRAATGDWLKMLAQIRRVLDATERTPPPPDVEGVDEGRALLAWMADQHFTFLGYRQYALERTPGGDDVLHAVPGTGLGLLRGAPERDSASFAQLPREIRARARDRELLVLTKANRRSTVHRPTYLDYVGVRTFGPDGEVTGEHRFLGLLTSGAYHSSPIDIPVLRQKVAAVVERAGLAPASHDQKDLVAILETYPRDDLFWTDVDTLYDTAMAILRLQERRQVRLSVHREVYGRFISCLVFLPRDRYTTPTRERIVRILTDAFAAESHEWNIQLSPSVLARLHFVFHVDPRSPRTFDLAALEAAVAAATRTWHDDLRDELLASHGEEEGLALLRIWQDAFPAAYRDEVAAADALADLATLTPLRDGDFAVRLAPGPNDRYDLKVFGVGGEPSLSDVLPLLTHLGVVVDDERPYRVAAIGMEPRWIKQFGLRVGLPAAPGFTTRLFEEALVAVVRGGTEDDGFNRLVIAAGCSWREVSLLRACSRYLRQIGTLYSQSYIEDALVAHPDITRALIELFAARFDPALDTDARDIDRRAAALGASLDAVSSLDEDRILRALLGIVQATVRTNWYATDEAGNPRPCTVLKLDPVRLPDLPAPRPVSEIFVYSPRVEGVHLRAGKVARGGVRWSDRREDYRTEVLALMKAQRVKNAVIVPSGAKGGFVVKRPPAGREELAREVEACYRLFVGGLLDVVDDRVDGAVVTPPGIVRHDGDDTYLVVAADKGTASFSDVANEVATARGFWLGDAFASGGSEGYDHKRMGITARGAWESVKWHFRELGVDVQATDFTVAGIGDMSGDVFGNGMLASRHIRLVAAFDHRHVFLDPDPDAARSWTERARLFEMPHSSWDDYDRALLSPGGGVHPRTAKAIPITPEVRARLGIGSDADSLTPAEVIREILRAPVDLLWNGGIGTHVKARRETHAEVGDKGNDSVRVDASDLRCRVVGEGGNLGFTQRARVEFALAGGLVHTDAIDNSAGVDTSDHEVNIKILLDRIVSDGGLDRAGRNELLRTMTDEVADLVLRDNYRQNRALANARAQAAAMLDVHGRLMRALEQGGQLDRAVERLPDDDALADRRNAGIGLTSPELAVLLASEKIAAEDELLASWLPDDIDLVGALEEYFPAPVRDRFAAQIAAHPLRREIVTTVLVNGMVNRAGVTFAFRLREETGAALDDVVRAHEVARAVCDQQSLWAAIEQLDGEVATATQVEMYLESRKLVERASRWLLRTQDRPLAIAATVDHFRDSARRVAAVLPDLLLGSERARVEQETARLASKAVPVDLATRIATLDALYSAFDLTEISITARRPVEEVAAVHCVVGDRLRLDWLADRVADLARADRWQALARSALREDTSAQHRAVTAAVVAGAGSSLEPAAAFERWAAGNPRTITRVLALLDDIRGHGVYDLATLSVALRELRLLV